MKASQAQLLRDMGLTPWVQRAAGNAQAANTATTHEIVPAVSAHGNQAEVLARAPVQATEKAYEDGDKLHFSGWSELAQSVSSCRRCALAEGRQQSVFGVGARAARWLLVGEAPGAEEDRRGEPFVGRAGKLLDAMLAALGLEREEVFITNIVKCRPPANRDPEPQEAQACRPYLDKQIEWVAPELILALGRVAAHQLLGVDTAVGRLRGRVHDGPGGRPIVVTYHPAYLLRTPIAKRKVWEDLKLALSTASPREDT